MIVPGGKLGAEIRARIGQGHPKGVLHACLPVQHVKLKILPAYTTRPRVIKLNVTDSYGTPLTPSNTTHDFLGRGAFSACAS